MSSSLQSPVPAPPPVPDFREHLATADDRGNRRWLYPQRPVGQFYRLRQWFSGLLLLVMFSGPFIKINGNPLLLFNLLERKFSILGQIFWPEDFFLFALSMLLFLTGIMIFTTAYGRLWCGWACPQTVMMEMVFRKIEWWIEGDGARQRLFNQPPWTRDKIVRKVFKHAIFFALSFVVGNTLLAYFIGIESLWQLVTDDPRNHLTSLAAMMGFTLLFYSIFARFREQACTFICPYGRFQSALLDENTLVVAYDHKRGEARGPWRRAESPVARHERGTGDCIDCKQCVAVCPTGIDIRNGVQMECVHCTACIDACDRVMDKIGQPRGLVRYASLNGIEKGEPLRLTPRMKGYAGILMVLGLIVGVLLFTRSDVETMLLRAPGSLYQTTASGNINNLYLMKMLNKTSRPIPVELHLEGREGDLKVMGPPVVVPARQLTQTSVLVELPPATLTGPSTKLRIGVYSGSKRLATVSTVFLGPRP